MEFNWMRVFLLLIVVGLPSCGVGCIFAWSDDHLILVIVLGIAFLVLLSLITGLPDEMWEACRV